MDRSTLSAAELRGGRVVRSFRPHAQIAPLAVLAAALAAVLALVLVLPVLRAGAPGVAPAAHSDRGLSGLASDGLASLPASALGPVSAALGAGRPAYAARTLGGALTTVSAPQRLHARFSRAGVQLSSAGTEVQMRLRTIAAGGQLRAVAPAEPVASANRVTIARPGVSEWYANGPLGLEQGFTLTAPSGARAGGAVTLALELTGNARATLDDGRLMLRGPHGAALVYGGLQAADAGGRVLPSRLRLQGGRLLIGVDARGARYPLRIDPLVQQGAKIPAQAPGAGELFGYSVAVAGDGNTALVGARHGDSAWVFVREGSTWHMQAALLAGVEEPEPTCEGAVEEECGFGRAVALSADGNTALIGAAAAQEHHGAAWVFVRTGTAWAQQGGRISPAQESLKGHFGAAVALSGDGSTAIIGGPADRSHGGSAWIFARSGTEWSESAKLVGTGVSEGTYFGRSVAISQDGSTVLVGGPGASANTGAAWAFGLTEGSWAQRGNRLLGGEESGESRFGYSVALSENGSTALVGGRGDASYNGAAWAFERQLGSGYIQQGPKLVGGEEAGAGELGYSAALSGDGNTAVLGGPRDGESVGAAWVFTRAGTSWSQQGAKRTGTGARGRAWFGSSAVLTPDAATALIGGFRDNGGEGAVWAFQQKPEKEKEEEKEEEKEKEPPEGPSGEKGTGTGGATQTNVTILGSGGVLGTITATLPAPTLAVNGNLAPISGLVRIKLPGSKFWILVTGLRQIPFGTIIDARKGKFTLTTAGPKGGTQTVTIYGGEVKITQSQSAVVILKLVGGNFKLCPVTRTRSKVARIARRSRKHAVRKLWTEGHGSYTTKGNYATGAVLGTRWLTVDRCDGTLIRVVTDKVLVRDLVRHKKHIVKAGHSYFVKAP